MSFAFDAPRPCASWTAYWSGEPVDDDEEIEQECVCAMTESSMNRCPVHGPDAPES